MITLRGGALQALHRSKNSGYYSRCSTFWSVTLPLLCVLRKQPRRACGTPRHLPWKQQWATWRCPDPAHRKSWLWPYWFCDECHQPDNFNRVGIKVPGFDVNVICFPAEREPCSRLMPATTFSDLKDGKVALVRRVTW